MSEAKTDIPSGEKMDMAPVWDVIVDRMLSSVLENFHAGGRPGWPALKSGLPSHLWDTGRLFGSISYGSGQDYAEVYTEGVPYAGVHQFGYPAKNIPARPFMKFQPSDIEFIVQTLGDGYVAQLTEPKRWRVRP